MAMRRLILVALFLWLTPVLAVGAGGLGLSVVPALVAGVVLAALAATAASRVMAARLRTPVPPMIVAALVLAAAVAILRFGALSVYMADVGRPQFSVEPDDNFRRSHSCVSAYAESARFLAEGGHNIYERHLYRPGTVARQLGPLQVDPFHYPPSFLLVPLAVRIVAPDFWEFRRVWFAFQALTLAGAVIGVAAWIGGLAGTVALLGGILLMAFPQAAHTFQQGNFQATAIPLAAIAFVLLTTGFHRTGGAVLAYASLAKIFPGVLVVPLIAARQWRPAAWVAGCGAAVLALTLVVQGDRPLRDFVSTSLPELSSGAAFPQTERRQFSRINFSAYGQTVRARHLGADWLTQPRGLAAVQVYGLLVVALAVWAGWKRRFDPALASERILVVQLALALLSLASFRSPFVGAGYGVLATLWLMGLLAAGASTLTRSVAWLAALCALASASWIIPSPGPMAAPMWLWVSGALVFAAMAVNVWAVVDVARSVRRPVRVSPMAAAIGTT
jgi:alpha-1,2-mannosyltransferase